MIEVKYVAAYPVSKPTKVKARIITPDTKPVMVKATIIKSPDPEPRTIKVLVYPVPGRPDPEAGAVIEVRVIKGEPESGGAL